MSATLNVHEAKTHFSNVIDRAHAGEEIIIAKAGKPWVRITKIDDAPKVKRTPGGWPGVGDIPDSVFFDLLPDEELDAWEGKYSDDFLK